MKVMHPKHRGGWTDWVYPLSRYFMKCCGCGLIHEMQFGTFVEADKKRDAFRVIPLPHPIRPMFRARRIDEKRYRKALVEASKVLKKHIVPNPTRKREEE